MKRETKQKEKTGVNAKQQIDECYIKIKSIDKLISHLESRKNKANKKQIKKEKKMAQPYQNM